MQQKRKAAKAQMQKKARGSFYLWFSWSRYQGIAESEAILSSIMATLYARSQETEEYGQRLTHIDNYSKEQLLERIEELELLTHELLADKKQEIRHAADVNLYKTKKSGKNLIIS
jgi:lipid A disaccharide synthetase